MATQLTDPWAPTPAVVCDFGWHDNLGDLFSSLHFAVNNINYPPTNMTWTVNGQTYTQNYGSFVTVLGRTVVFDATDILALGLPTTVAPAGVQIVSYEWDLGNGVTGAGPTISTVYNYTTPPPDMAATLTVFDSLGRRYSTTHPLNLVALTFVSGAENWPRQGSART